MAIIKIEHLTFSYGIENIFNDVSLNIDTDWKLGLIGRNGKGKTTLLNILLNKLEYNGKINSTVNFEYFPYEIKNKNETVYEVAKQISNIDYEWKFLKEFNSLKLKDDILYRKFNTLSNGEQTKVMIAILFLKENNFLLIDEPTNFLDLESRKILSDYLNTKKGFILVSHDRNFLDNTIDHVLSINRNDIYLEQGNFTSWNDNKTNQDNYEIDKNKKLKKEIKRLESASIQKSGWSGKVEATLFHTKNSGLRIDRGYVSHKSAKMMSLAKNIEHRQNKLIDDKKQLLKNIEEIEDLKLFPIKYHNNILLSFNHVNIFYDNKDIVTDLNFNIENGDRVLISGKNGSGKSSILKIILGINNNYTGDIVKSDNLKNSYIEQDTNHLFGTLNNYIYNNSVDQTLFKSILRKLDFERNDFDKEINNFSEGMKKKIVIARSLCESANLYVWDEPLNYIDVISRMQIEKVILEYKPTIIFVEHDKKFCDIVATKIIKL